MSLPMSDRTSRRGDVKPTPAPPNAVRGVVSRAASVGDPVPFAPDLSTVWAIELACRGLADSRGVDRFVGVRLPAGPGDRFEQVVQHAGEVNTHGRNG